MQEELEKIKDQITQLAREVSNVESEYGTTSRRMDRLNETVFRIEKELREILFGNGRPGMAVEIDRLKEDNKRLKIEQEKLQTEIRQLAEYKTEQKGSIRAIFWFVGVGVTILIGLIIAWVTKK